MAGHPRANSTGKLVPTVCNPEDARHARTYARDRPRTWRTMRVDGIHQHQYGTPLGVCQRASVEGTTREYQTAQSILVSGLRKRQHQKTHFGVGTERSRKAWRQMPLKTIQGYDCP